MDTIYVGRHADGFQQVSAGCLSGAKVFVLLYTLAIQAVPPQVQR